jgi:hypothetical protein
VAYSVWSIGHWEHHRMNLLLRLKWLAHHLRKPSVYKKIVILCSIFIFVDCAITVRWHFDYKPLDWRLLSECFFWGGIAVFGFVLSIFNFAVRFRWWLGIPCYLCSFLGSMVVIPHTNFQFFVCLGLFLGYGLWRFFIEGALWKSH